ncbi:MAG TPA: protein translocase subunit SecD [Gemmatimonadaceae bacterium]|jgi:preprotein translocase subunit SecD|nr:protein translocase subunit SecD [Gemmatimonadaceae bacterium]
MSNLKLRIATVLALIAVSIWFLAPRTVIELKRGPNGEPVYSADSTPVLDTVKRVPLREGLDLQGGIHMSLEPDESKGTIANKSDAIDRALTVVRTRIDAFGVTEPVVQKIGTDRILVELPGIDDPSRARSIVEQSAFLQFQIVDKTQALDKAISHIDAILRAHGYGGPAPVIPGAAPANGVASLFSNPSDTGKKKAAAGAKAGTKKDSTPPADTSALAATLTGGPFSKLVQQGQMPGEYYVAKSDAGTVGHYLGLPEVQSALPPGKVIRWSSDTASLGGKTYRTFYVLDAKAIATGENLIDAKPQSDPTEGTMVTFTLNREGGRQFQKQTAQHIHDYMAIVLDTLVMGRPPIIQGAIGTRGQITMGGRDLQAAQDLALVLRAGALPVPLRVIEMREIGASLGQDSVRAGIRAGVIAIALVVLIMLVYYRFSGLLAVGGLMLYVLYTLAMLAGFDAVLTLPGLAGFVLSIGIAVDANVLIFERIREELAHGKTVRTAIDEGFRHAMNAIIDSNVTTALTAAVLYQYGSGPVRGFAVTLLAGILASMVTSIFVVRTFFNAWLSRTRGAQPLSI